MKIFITGVGGFIGSHLADRLLPHHDIIGVDNFETGRRDNIPKGVIFNEYSITENWIQEFIEHFSPDILIHTAASYKDPNNWMKDADTNVRGTAWLCYLAKKYGVKRIIYFQTSLCYGLKPQEQPATINCPVSPAPNSYAITKTAAEQIISMSGVPFISLRLANIYGPRTLTGAIPAFYKKIKNNEVAMVSDTRRDFVYIDSLVNLVERIVNGEGEKNYYHVSTGMDYRIYDIFSKMDTIIGEASYSELVFRKPDDAEMILLDCSETIHDFPGWVADTPLDVGLYKTIVWYDENGVGQSYTHLKKE